MPLAKDLGDNTLWYIEVENAKDTVHYTYLI